MCAACQCKPNREEAESQKMMRTAFLADCVKENVSYVVLFSEIERNWKISNHRRMAPTGSTAIYRKIIVRAKDAKP